MAVADKRTDLPRFERLHFEGHTLTGQQLLEASTAAVGRPLKCQGLPWPLLRVMSWINPMLRAVLEMRYLWETPHSLEDGKLRALIGTAPHTPTATAVQRALTDLSLAKVDP